MKRRKWIIGVVGLLMAISVIGQLGHPTRTIAIPALTAYNFGSLGELEPNEQLKLLREKDYKGIILNTETKRDSVQLDFFLNELTETSDFNIHAVMVRFNFTDPLLKRESWKIIVDRIARRNIELWFIVGTKAEGLTDCFLIEKLKEVVDYAKSNDVKVVLYPHSKCYLASAEEALPFVQQIDDPYLTLAVHLCHEIRAGNGSRLDDVFSKVKKHISAVTVCGTDSVADFSRPVLMDKSTIKPIGQGNFKLSRFLEPMLQANYAGRVGFINFKIDEDPAIYLESSIKNWKHEFLKTKY